MTLAVARMIPSRWLCLILPFFFCVALNAAEPADAQIRGALADIERYEADFAGQRSANRPAINRTLRLLGLTRDRLDSSTNRNHPSWIDADARLNALVAHLESMIEPASSGQAAPSRPAPAPVAQASGAAEMISQQRVRIQRLIRDVASASETLNQGGVKPFQSAEYGTKQDATLRRFRESLANFSEFATDPDVVEATRVITAFESMIEVGREKAAQQIEALGDVQARLRAIEQALRTVPEPPPWPYTSEAVSSWVVSIARARKRAEDALQHLFVIREHAYLPDQRGTVPEGAPYDMQDVARLDAGYRRNVDSIDASLSQFSADLDLNVTHIGDTLAFVENLDPANEHHQSNNFTGAGAADRVREQLAQARQLAVVAVDFDRQLGREQLDDHQAVLGRVEAAVQNYESNREKALQLVRVPKAASTDRNLLAIATQTLEKPDYEVGRIKRLVVNADKVHREMETSEAEFDKVDVSLSGRVTLSGTKTTYKYSWDQFQVATVEPVGDAHFIFFNTLKHFTSGGPTTPLNRWLLAERIQGSEILEQNIDRD